MRLLNALPITDEIHQFFVPGRYASVFDAGIDSLGAMMSTLTYLVSVEWRKNAGGI